MTLHAKLSFDDFDEARNPGPETTDFDRVVETALSRRGFLGGVMTFGLGSFLVGTSAMTRPAQAQQDRLGFTCRINPECLFIPYAETQVCGRADLPVLKCGFMFI